MKDIIQFVMYAVVSFGVIILLIKMSASDAFGSTMVVMTAIFLVVILPVFVAVKIAKKERESRQ